jgi:hypothetical protein
MHISIILVNTCTTCTQVGDIATGVANIIADPTTAGKIYEFVGYVAKVVLW